MAGLLAEVPGRHFVILAALLLWARVHGSDAWRSYCRLLPAEPHLACLLNYGPGELALLQAPHLIVRALSEESKAGARRHGCAWDEGGGRGKGQLHVVLDSDASNCTTNAPL